MPPPAPTPAPRPSSPAQAGGDLALAAAQVRLLRPPQTPARAAPVSCSCWTRLRDRGEPGKGQERAPRLRAAPAGVSLHPLPGRADGGPCRWTPAPVAAPAEAPVVAVPEPANRSRLPSSREISSRDSPRAEILPNMEPPRGRGFGRRERRRSSSREKRATAGAQRQELPGTVLRGAEADG